MTRPDPELLAAAHAVLIQAHAPYSGLRVGAAVRSAAGEVYVGCNVENAAFPLGNCAEASAIAAGVAGEGQGFRIAAVAVQAEHADGTLQPVSPCGGCRQRIREFAVDGAIPVSFPWSDGAIKTLQLDELLPYSFELQVRPGR